MAGRAMTAHDLVLTDEQQASLRAIAQHTGKTEQELIREAVDPLIRHYRRALLRQARGMWRDRTDLPDFAAIRREFDRPRQGWGEQFKAMAANGDDQLPDWGDQSLTTWDEEEWEW
jgi:hypothetical protein